MPRELITLADLQLFKVELLDELENRFAQKIHPQREIMRSSEVRELLNISAGTLQNLRITGKLKYTKINGLMFYHRTDVLKLLEYKD